MAQQSRDIGQLVGWDAVVHQALGMMAVQIDGTVEAATERLMSAADSSSRPAHCVAQDVVARRLRFAPKR